MAQVNTNEQPPDDIDAFFAAAEQDNWNELKEAAQNVAKPQEQPNLGGFTHPSWGAAFTKKHKPLVTPAYPETAEQLPPELAAEMPPAVETPPAVEAPPPPPEAERPAPVPPAPSPARPEEAPRRGDEEEFILTSEEEEALIGGQDLDGKFIAIDPASIPGMADDPDKPFVLIPAHVHQYVPLWGWVAIASTLFILVAGVVLLPGISLSRLTNRLGDANEAAVRGAMRQLVMNGDERTVRKLYDLAASPGAGLTARLRAVDTMSLIERVPEVDRALLRLELSADTNDQVREAAIAARRQRETYRTRGGQ